MSPNSKRQTSTGSTTPVSPIYDSSSSTTNITTGTAIDGLPIDLRNGMIAMGYFGLLSAISTLMLLIFITHRMIFWKRFYDRPILKSQIFILIYNLLLADFQQALSFLISFHWLVEDRIVESNMCFGQAWLIQIGDLSSGLWVLTIAVHTGINLVAEKEVPRVHFTFGVIFIWVFCVVVSLLGPLLHQENFFVPVGAWCWIGPDFQDERLYLHYLWIFIAQLGSVLVYATVFFKLRRRLSFFKRFMPLPEPESRSHAPSPSLCFRPTTTVTTIITNYTHDPFGASRERVARAARYMVVYPTAYVALTLPLATGRVAAMSGKDWGSGYYCIAGALIASCGMVDVILYIYTRKGLVQSSVGVKSDRMSNLTRSGSQRVGLIRRQSDEPITLGELMAEEGWHEERKDGIVVSKTVLQTEGSIAPSPEVPDDITSIPFERPVSLFGRGGKEDRGSWFKKSSKTSLVDK